MSPSEVLLAFKSIENDLSDDLLKMQLQQKNGELKSQLEERLKIWPTELSQRLKAEFFGLGPLDSLLQKNQFNEILVLQHDKIFVETPRGLESYPDTFLSPWTFRNAVQRLMILTQSKCDYNKAAVDSYYGQYRMHIIQKPLIKSDFELSFRYHPAKKWQLEDLQQTQSLKENDYIFLRSMIAERKNFLVVGPTSSGKTTLLKACLNAIPENERVVVLEDSYEISVPNEVSTHLLARQENLQELRDYSLGDLLRESLRMRPDRIVVGEVRGPEAKDLLLCLSTGHAGSMGTLHASSAAEALFRLEFLVQMGAPQWSLESIRRLIFLSLQYIVVVRRADGRRDVDGIYRINSLESFGMTLEQVTAGSRVYATTSK